MMVDGISLLRLRVLTEADPGALLRVLERFQNMGVVPRRVIVESTTTDSLSILVDVTGLDESRMSLIAAKLGQIPNVLRAHWHYA